MLSVIIPTKNRWVILQRALEAYLKQTALEEVSEILVCDDGSTDKTPSVVSEIAKVSPVPIRYLRQEHRGAAAARNLAIKEARGALVLFTDDDVIPSSTLVAEHFKWHRENPDPGVAVLGPVPWDEEVHPTPFMNWLITGGPMLNLRECSKRRELGFEYFATGNLSLKAKFLREHGTFDEDFRAYGYEDYELGYRLASKGLRLLYNPNAVGYHHKFVSFADVCRRAQQVAEAEKVLRTKEAGAYLSERAARSRQSLGIRIGKFLARRLAFALAPLKPLLDTHVPLPRFAYRALYYAYCKSPARRPNASVWKAEKGQATVR
jgi:glycosyltransferase involved in cell wall biosynthesis